MTVLKVEAWWRNIAGVHQLVRICFPSPRQGTSILLGPHHELRVARTLTSGVAPITARVFCSRTLKGSWKYMIERLIKQYETLRV